MANDLSLNLCAYWKFDDSSTGTAVNSLSSGNLTAYSGPKQDVSGLINAAVQYDSSLSAFYNTSVRPFPGDVSAFSVSLWVYPDVSLSTLGRSWQMIRAGTSPNCFSIQINYATNQIAGYIYDVSNNYVFHNGVANTILEKQWNHVVVSWEINKNPSIYVNNVNRTSYLSTTLTKNVAIPNLSFVVGNGYAGNNLAGPGKLDEVGIWTRALSAAEVSLLYNNANGFSYPFIEDVSVTVDLSTGLQAYWKLDENTGTTLYDSVGVNNLTSSGAVLGSTDAVVGRSVEFDTSTDYLQDLSITGLDASDNECTVSFWAKFDTLPMNAGYNMNLIRFQSNQGYGSNAPTATLTMNGFNDSYNYVAAYTYNLEGSAYGVETGTAKVTFSTGTWYHIVYTYKDSTYNDPSRGIIYINGVNSRVWSNNREFITPTIVQPNYYVCVGNSYGGARTGIDGKIDEVGYWNRALTPTEVSTLYNNGLGVTYPTFAPDTTTVPTVTTTSISSISYFTATGGGNVTDDGSIALTYRGICWGTSTNPTIADTSVQDAGTGEGSYVSYLTNLSSSTNYYVRAWAYNSKGISYGDNVQFSTLQENDDLSITINGTAYYVSNNGSDNYTGLTPATAWQSITKVNASMGSLTAGDGIFFKGGQTFTGTITLSKSGTSGNPITLGSYGSGLKATVTGFSTLSTWNSVGNGIYRAANVTCESSINMVTVDGTQYPMGKWPNTGWNHIVNTNGTNIISDTSITSAYDWTGAELVIRKNRWVIDRVKILTHNSSSLTFDTGGTLPSSYPPTAGWGYFIQGDLSTLDDFGDWYYDKSGQYLYMYFGATNPSDYIIKAATLDRGISNTGYQRAYVTIDSLKFEGFTTESMYLWNNIQYFNVQNCEVYYSGKKGIYMHYPYHSNITDNYIQYTNSQAIGVDSAGNDGHTNITGNRIYDTGVYPGLGENSGLGFRGIVCIGHYGNIQNNTIINTGYIPIYYGGIDTVIKNNYINTYCFNTDDGGGIYIYDDRNPGKIVTDNILINAVGAGESGNILTDGYPTSSANGLYTDGWSAHISYINNTCSSISKYGYHANSSTNIVLSGNKFYQCKGFIDINKYLEATRVVDLSIYNNTYVSTILDETYPLGIHLSNYSRFDVSTLETEISNLGYIDNNYYYANTECAVIIERIMTGATLYEMAPRSFKGWSNTFGHDTNSVFVPPFQEYSINSLGSNMITNSTFDSNITGWTGTATAPIYWDNGALKLTNLNKDYEYHWWTSSYFFYTPLSGSIDNSKNYIIRLLGRSETDEKTIAVRTYQTGTYYHDQRYFVIGDTSTEKEILYKNPGVDGNNWLRVVGCDGDVSLYFDNFYMYEADVNLIDTTQYFVFEYNPSAGVYKTVTLDDANYTYRTLSGTYYTSSIDISSFNSILLIKQAKSETTLLTNLVSYWKCDETTDTSLYDSYSTNHLSVYDASLNVLGKINTGIEFDNSTNTAAQIAPAAMTGLQNISNQVTVSAWIKLNTLPSTLGIGSYIITLSNATRPWEAFRLFGHTNDTLAFGISSSDGTASGTYYTVYSSSTLDTGNWHHVAGIYDTSTVKVYYDGQHVSSTTVNFSGSIHNDPYRFAIGNYYLSANNYTDGTIDEVGIWSRALSDAEILQLYNVGKGLTYPFEQEPINAIGIYNGFFLTYMGQIVWVFSS